MRWLREWNERRKKRAYDRAHARILSDHKPTIIKKGDRDDRDDDPHRPQA
jgi:hypothetical protein